MNANHFNAFLILQVRMLVDVCACAKASQPKRQIQNDWWKQQRHKETQKKVVKPIIRCLSVWWKTNFSKQTKHTNKKKPVRDKFLTISIQCKTT